MIERSNVVRKDYDIFFKCLLKMFFVFLGRVYISFLIDMFNNLVMVVLNL